MPILRDVWTPKAYANDQFPDWPCPGCHKGLLEVDAASIRTKETAVSRNREDYDPVSAQFVFSALLQCNHKKCQDVVACCGTAFTDKLGSQVALQSAIESQEAIESKENDGQLIETQASDDYEMFQTVNLPTTLFRPLHFCPTLHVFRISDLCPRSVNAELVASFATYFSDLNACANRVRASVEVLLTEQGIRRFVTKQGKRHRLSLHSRIEEFRVKNPVAADSLMAIKWIGNAGSHLSSVVVDDILDAYEIVEVVLDDMFIGHAERIARITKNVNKKRGPLSRKPLDEQPESR